MNEDPYDKYYTENKVTQKDLEYAWKTAIGLQAVDQLQPSEYLYKTANRNIKGEIDLYSANKEIEDYYETRSEEAAKDKEADLVSVRIATILSQDTFNFSPSALLSIHKRLFDGLLPGAGKLRNVNISKKEWILNGKSVMYGDVFELKTALDYDFSQEKDYDYKGKTIEEIIHHLSTFIAGIWQIHPFSEGNTRTTAVFLILYLRSLGFRAESNPFADNSWYFRNALVRANYSDLNLGIARTAEYLELFMRNLLLNEKNELKNRYLHISNTISEPDKIKEQSVKYDIKGKTGRNIEKLYNRFGVTKVFSRTDVISVLGITTSPASTLLMRMLEEDIIEVVRGYGKGHYRFI